MGTLPVALSDLTTTVSNAQGLIAGPFLAGVPTPPGGGSPAWSLYDAGYATRPDGSFTISATGDNTTIVVP